MSKNGQRAWSQFLGSALALALAGSEVASQAHFALVRHTTCSDHGLLIHAAAPRGHGHRTSSLRTDELTQADPDEALGHAHDHCPVPFLRRDVAGDEAGPARLARRPTPALFAPASTTRARDGRAVWRVAPKQSPPRA